MDLVRIGLKTDLYFIHIKNIWKQVSFPPEIAAITLGASTGNVNNTNINIIMSVFSTPVLFFSPSLLNFSSENPGVNRTANTPVILLSVGGVVVADLDQSINLTFTALVVRNCWLSEEKKKRVY